MLFIPWHFPLYNNPEIQGASKEAETEFKKQYPAIYNHLLQYKEKLSNRNKAETGIRYEWYALQRFGSNYWDDFSKPKLIYPETTQGAFFAYEENCFMIDKTCFMLISEYAKYLQVILSSKLFEFAYKRIFSSIELGDNGYQYNKHALLKLSIKIPKQEDIESFRKLEEKELDSQIFNMYSISDIEKEYIFENI